MCAYRRDRCRPYRVLMYSCQGWSASCIWTLTNTTNEARKASAFAARSGAQSVEFGPDAVILAPGMSLRVHHARLPILPCAGRTEQLQLHALEVSGSVPYPLMSSATAPISMKPEFTPATETCSSSTSNGWRGVSLLDSGVGYTKCMHTDILTVSIMAVNVSPLSALSREAMHEPRKCSSRRCSNAWSLLAEANCSARRTQHSAIHMCLQ